MDKYGYTQKEIERQGHSTECRNGKMIYSNEDAIVAIIEGYDPLPEAKADAIKRIRDQAQEMMQSTESDYPSFERQTWPYQRIEVEAWELDNSAKTPTIDSIAQSKGAARQEQLERTLLKVNEFKAASNHLVGRRQHFESLIKDSSDIDFICTLNFEA